MDDEPVAVAALKLHGLEDLFPEKNYWPGSVSVNKGWHSEGMGIRITQCLSTWRSAGSCPIFIFNLQAQNPTGGLYARVDWVPSQQLSVKSEDTLLMIKLLDNA